VIAPGDCAAWCRRPVPGRDPAMRPAPAGHPAHDNKQDDGARHGARAVTRRRTGWVAVAILAWFRDKDEHRGCPKRSRSTIIGSACPAAGGVLAGAQLIPGVPRRGKQRLVIAGQDWHRAGPVRAENPVRGSDQQGCSPGAPAVRITDHVPAVRVPPDYADWSRLPVLGLVRESLAEVGKMPVQMWIRKGGRYPAHVLSGRRSTGIGCGRPAAQRRARTGPGRQWGGEMQQDSAGLDGT
jgi:hypothetical protein